MAEPPQTLGMETLVGEELGPVSQANMRGAEPRERVHQAIRSEAYLDSCEAVFLENRKEHLKFWLESRHLRDRLAACRGNIEKAKAFFQEVKIAVST